MQTEYQYILRIIRGEIDINKRLLTKARQVERKSDYASAMDSIDRAWLEGKLEALIDVAERIAAVHKNLFTSPSVKNKKTRKSSVKNKSKKKAGK